MKAGVKIDGVAQLIKNIQLTSAEIHKACKRGIDRTALAIESDAKRKITADRHIITGRLRSSIHAELKEGQRFDYNDQHGNSFDGSLQESIEEMEAIVGTNVKYAPYIEYGTKYISADSYLGWAANKNDKLLKARIMHEIEKIRT